MAQSVLQVPAGRSVPAGAYAKTDYTEAVLPEGVKVIEPKAFQYCAQLRTLRLPRTLTHIELKAFEDCRLEDIWYAGSAAEWENVEISPVQNGCILAARKHFAVPGEAPVRAARPDRSPALYARLRALLESGGDGQLHIFAPEMLIPGSYTKYGDLSLLIFPRGSTMILDAGSERYASRAREFADRSGLRKVDYLAFSHADGDHVTGGPGLIRHLWTRGAAIGSFLWSGQRYGDAVPQMIEMLSAAGAQIDTNVRAGRSFEIDGVRLDILGPTEEDMLRDANVGRIRNAQSVIMRFTHGKGRFLTSGDLFKADEEAVVARCGAEALRADVMKTNHHGGYTSTFARWLDAVRPKLAYSCSDDNGCVRLAEDLARRGAAYYATGCQGMLHITLDAEGGVACESQYDGMRCIQRLN